MPEYAVIENDRQSIIHLAGLPQSEDLEQFIERAEAAGKDDEGVGAHGEMHFAHREVMEAESELRRRIGIGLLLTRQRDIVADRGGANVMGAAIGRFHDARAATGGNYILPRAGMAMECAASF